MLYLVCKLVFMLLIIFVAAEIFTNALEHLGEKLKISEGVTGSLFAAVGTALPETLVPLLAIFAGTKNQAINEEIGVGAILGAPLMLSTLSLCLMACAILSKRGLKGLICPERTGMIRDLNFFLFAFSLAALALYTPFHSSFRIMISITLVLTYLIYIVCTLRASDQLVGSGHGTIADKKMLFARIGLPTHLFIVCLQLSLGLGLLIIGARGFIQGVEGVAHLLNISALLLSLLIIPIATELPEKVNSILWIRKGRDTLAFGNITGAMVFQGTLLPALGIMLTPWQPRIEVISGIIITLAAALWLRLGSRAHGLRVWTLLLNGVLYITYLFVTIIPALY